MNENTKTNPAPVQIPASIPVRCSICGQKFLNLYPNSLPGIVFATCLNGHKTSYRTEGITRKAV